MKRAMLAVLLLLPVAGCASEGGPDSGVLACREFAAFRVNGGTPTEADERELAQAAKGSGNADVRNGWSAASKAKAAGDVPGGVAALKTFSRGCKELGVSLP